jgi:hypothetical protein
MNRSWSASPGPGDQIRDLPARPQPHRTRPCGDVHSGMADPCPSHHFRQPDRPWNRPRDIPGRRIFSPEQNSLLCSLDAKTVLVLGHLFEGAATHTFGRFRYRVVTVCTACATHESGRPLSDREMVPRNTADASERWQNHVKCLAGRHRAETETDSNGCRGRADRTVSGFSS